MTEITSSRASQLLRMMTFLSHSKGYKLWGDKKHNIETYVLTNGVTVICEISNKYGCFYYQEWNS